MAKFGKYANSSPAKSNRPQAPRGGCKRCFSGFIPIVSETDKGAQDGRAGRVVESVVTCNCARGRWFNEAGHASYDDLEWSVKEEYEPLTDKFDIQAFNRQRYTDICKKLGHPYYDYETNAYVGFPDAKLPAARVKAFKTTAQVLADGASYGGGLLPGPKSTVPSASNSPTRGRVKEGSGADDLKPERGGGMQKSCEERESTDPAPVTPDELEFF